MRHLDLFSGIGGFALAARNVGWETIGFCEIEPFCQKVLKKHWPDVPIHEDIKKLKGGGIDADIITGGFPCQDISVANQKAEGIKGKRSGLWKEMARLVSEVRPGYVVVENVRALLIRGIGTVLGDLADLGYDSEWHCIPASALGAPHLRERMWIVAYPDSKGTQGLVKTRDISKIGPWRWRSEENMPIEWLDGGARWPKPLIRRMDDGISNRVDKLRGLGNAIVPQVAEVIFRAIEESRK